MPNTAPTHIEDSYAAQGITPVAGVDEAGRGALAGPVVACALILPPGLVIPGVQDSKKLSPKTREILAQEIKAQAIAYAFGIVDAPTIDTINILQGALLAMANATKALNPAPNMLLVDGNQMPPGLPCPAITITQGDSKSHLIAAASILAKVARDTMMETYHHQYPAYGFAAHKGYGTQAHRAAIAHHGLCPQHRTSFRQPQS